MNIEIVNDLITKVINKDLDLCMSLTLIQDVLNISILSNKEQYMYNITLYDECDHDYERIHVKNGHNFRKWILKCVLTNHIKFITCPSRRYNDDSPLILFTWDDDYVDRLEIPQYLMLD